MSIPVYYLSLPHDLSGSRSKNRFRAELLWGVSKILDLMEEDQDFTMVFDYACDIEVHYENGFEFFQIKTHDRCKSYTTKRLTKVKGENSILGKLYVLVRDRFPGEVRVAVVSNVPYSSMPADMLVNCFLNLPDKDQKEITMALKEELRIDSIDLSKLFYVQTNMDLEHPDDAIRGKLTLAFEKIKKCEPTNPNALYRLIVDTVSGKACYEYSAIDYNEILRLKGLTRKQFDELLDLHAEKSKTGISAATKYIDQLPNIRDRMIYKRSLPNALKLLSTSWSIKEIESEIAKFLLQNDVGNMDSAIDILISKFNDRFPVEVSQVDKEVIYIVVIKRFEDGVYGYEDDI